MRWLFLIGYKANLVQCWIVETQLLKRLPSLWFVIKFLWFALGYNMFVTFLTTYLLTFTRWWTFSQCFSGVCSSFHALFYYIFSMVLFRRRFTFTLVSTESSLKFYFPWLFLDRNGCNLSINRVFFTWFNLKFLFCCKIIKNWIKICEKLQVIKVSDPFGCFQN